MYKVYFLKDDTNYVKTLTPLALTASMSDAYTETVDWSKDESEIVLFANKSLKIVEQLFKSGFREVFLDFQDDTSKAIVYRIKLLTDVDPKVLGLIKPGVTLSPVEQTAFDKLMAIYAVNIEDIILRTSIAAPTIKKVVDDMKASLGLKTPDLSGSKGIDNLIKEINEKTKATVVKPKEKLTDYVCDKLLMDELTELKEFFEKRKIYKAGNIELPKGILFKGPPGTGKTYAARCIAGSIDCFFMSCTASALQGMYIGSGAENIREVFKAAKVLAEKSKKGVFLFLDEIDSFGSRDSIHGSAGGEESRTINQLLAEMSGFTDVEDVMVIAATNYPEKLDKALLRSGRFDRQITIGYPEDAERLAMVTYYFNKITIPKELSGPNAFTYDEISKLTKGLTPADIKLIANESGILTIRGGRKMITLADINEAINKVITKNIRHPDKGGMKQLVLVTAHEVGHVMAEVYYNNAYPIKVTNYSYGDAGGFTQMSSILNGIKEKKDYIAKVLVSLAGRAAEEVICGYITNGASADLDSAKRILKSYYIIYNFDKYKVKDIDQIIIDDINRYYQKVVDDFKKDDIKNAMLAICKDLKTKRVLYPSDFSVYLAKFKGKGGIS